MKKWVTTASLVLGLLLFGYIIGDLPLGETISLLENARVSYLFWFVIVTLGMMATHVVRWSIVLNSMGVKLPFHRLFSYRVADYTMCYLTPGPKFGGEVTRVGLLHEEEKMTYSKALSSVVIDKSLDIFGNSLAVLIGVIAITVLVPLPMVWKIALYAVSITYLVFMLSFILMERNNGVAHPLFRKLNPEKRPRLKKAEESMVSLEKRLKKFYRKDSKHFIMALIVSTMGWGFVISEFKLLLLMLGFNLPLEQVFFIILMMGLTYMTPIPMGLGILEAGQVSVFAILGLPTKAGVMLALLTRTRDLLWSALGIAILGYYGLRVRDLVKKSQEVVRKVI